MVLLYLYFKQGQFGVTQNYSDLDSNLVYGGGKLCLFYYYKAGSTTNVDCSKCIDLFLFGGLSKQKEININDE